MNIITGHGKSRKVFVFPDASIVNSSPRAEQEAARDMLCRMLSIPLETAA